MMQQDKYQVNSGKKQVIIANDFLKGSSFWGLLFKTIVYLISRGCCHLGGGGIFSNYFVLRLIFGVKYFCFFLTG